MAMRNRLVAGIVCTATIFVAAGIFFAVRAVENTRRMSRVHVIFDSAADGYHADRETEDQLLSKVIRDNLNNFEISSKDDSIRTIRAISTPFHASEPDQDAIITPGRSVYCDCGFIAFDPYVLIADTNAGVSPTATTGASIRDWIDWAGSLDTRRFVPVVVAGDERSEFASFILYISGEILSRTAYESLLETLSDYHDEAGIDAAVIERLRNVVAPVAELVEAWRGAGILAYNWTDWDYVAKKQAILDGGGASVFSRRSFYKSFSRQERANLEVHRLPSGEARRSYQMVGQGLGIYPGDGPLSGEVANVKSLLLSNEIQYDIEASSLWTPLARTGSVLNQEHRDIVRWLNNAGELMNVTSELIAHPLFEHLHRELR